MTMITIILLYFYFQYIQYFILYSLEFSAIGNWVQKTSRRRQITATKEEETGEDPKEEEAEVN